MLFAAGAVLALCIANTFAFLTPLETQFSQIATSLIKGDLEPGQIDEALGEIGLESDQFQLAQSLISQLVTSNKRRNAIQQKARRKKRAVPNWEQGSGELIGPLHYVDLTVDNITISTAYTFPQLDKTNKDSVHSKVFNLGMNNHYSFLVIENHLYSLVDRKLLDLNKCVDDENCQGDTDKEILVNRFASINKTSGFVLQVYLTGSTYGGFSQLSVMAWEVVLISDPLVAVSSPSVKIGKLHSFQEVYLSLPMNVDNAYVRSSMLSTESGIIGATLYGYKNASRVERITCFYIANDNDKVEFPKNDLLDSVDIRIGATDVGVFQIFQKDLFVLVVARKETTYVFRLMWDVYTKQVSVALIQKIQLADPVEIQFSADSLGSYLVLIESTGEVSTYIWENFFFVSTQTFLFPHLQDGIWLSVETSQSLDLPNQELVVAGNGENLGFFHHVLPGIFERLDKPTGIRDLTKLYRNNTLIDIGRTKVSADYYEYYILLRDEDNLYYVKLDLGSVPKTVENVNDVSLCLTKLESKLMKDRGYAQEVANFITDSIPLDQPFVLSSNSAQIGFMKVNGEIIINKPVSVTLTKPVVEIDSLDYGFPSSKLSKAYSDLRANESSTDMLTGNILLVGKDYSNDNLVLNISAPEIDMSLGKFDKLTVDEIDDLKTDTLLSKTLRLTGSQEVNIRMNFETLKVKSAELTEHATSTHPVNPSTLVDLNSSEPINFEIEFETGVLNKHSIISTTLNDISLKDVVTVKEIANSNINNPVSIKGKKNFLKGLNTYSLKVINMNEIDYESWFQQLLFKHVSHQTLDISSLIFHNITVLDHVTLDRLEGVNMNDELLTDFVRFDQPAIINADTYFYSEVEIENLITSSLNESDPNDYLIFGIEQEINGKVTARKISSDKIQAHDINGIDLDEAARTDVNNTFYTPIGFTKDITVKENVYMKDGVTLGDLDPSIVKQNLQIYKQPITITSELIINDYDVELQDIIIDNIIAEGSFDQIGLEDIFLMKDLPQTLPNMRQVNSAIKINTMDLNKTLNNIDIDTNVLFVDGNQDVMAENLVFDGTSYFWDDLTLMDFTTGALLADAKIAGVGIQDVANNVICGKNAQSDFSGSLVIIDHGDNKIVSHFDLNVENDFVYTMEDGFVKNIGVFNEKVVKLDSSNEFSSHMKFEDKSVIHSNLMSQDIDGETSATLNGAVLRDFDTSILHKNGNFTMGKSITFKSIEGEGVLKENGRFDGKDLVQQLEDHILLDDDKPIHANLGFENLEVKGVYIIYPTHGDDSYFASEDLADYVHNVLLFNTTVITGDKILAGSLAVNGDIITEDPFEANISNWQKNILMKNGKQEIARQVHMETLQATSIFLNEINGVALSDFCFRDENCILETSVPEKVFELKVLEDVVFSQGLSVDGNLNSKSIQERILSLANSEDDKLINNLFAQKSLEWQNEKAGVPVLSDLFKDAVVKSNTDWYKQQIPHRNLPTFSNGQNITGKVVLNSNVIVNTLDILRSTIGQNNFDLDFMINDLVQTDSVNKITSSKVFETANVKHRLDVKVLNTVFINDVDIKDYMESALMRSSGKSEPQKIKGKWTFSNGFEVEDTAKIFDSIDGIKVKDFVLKSLATRRPVQPITLQNDLLVIGDTESSDSDMKIKLDDFFSSTVKIDENQDFEQNVTFKRITSFTNLEVGELNGIPTDDIIKNKASDTQIILQSLSLDQDELLVVGDLNTLVNDANISEINRDVLRLDREETIDAMKVIFEEVVFLLNNEIVIPEKDFSSLVDTFIKNLAGFSQDLVTYYNLNIIDPIRMIMEELFVSKHIGYTQIDYFDKYTVPSELDVESNNFTTDGLETIEMGQKGYLIRFENSEPGSKCSMANECTCLESRFVHGYETELEVFEFQNRVDVFKLKSGLFSVTVGFIGYSDICRAASPAEITVEATISDEAATSLNLMGISAEQIGSINTPFKISNIYEVKEVMMWVCGSTTYLAVSEGYNSNRNTDKVSIFSMDSVGRWTKQIYSHKFSTEPVIHMKVNSFSIEIEGSFTDISHLILYEENSKEVHIYEWSYNLKTATFQKNGDKIQSLQVNELMSMEVFQHFNLAYIALASRVQVQLSYSSYVTFYQYSPSDGSYMWSVLPQKLFRIGSSAVLKMKAEKLTNKINLVMATEYDGVQIFTFMPNQGLNFIGAVNVDGRVIDMTVYRHTLPRYMSKNQFTHFIYVLSEYAKQRHTHVFKVALKGQITLPDLVFNPDSLGVEGSSKVLQLE